MTAVAIIGFATITFGQTVPSNVPTTGLVGWWPFTGNANDESGNGNNGTVNGATLTIDRFGNANSAYSFNSVPDRIDIGSSLGPNTSIGAPNTSWSASAWINRNNLNGVVAFTDYNSIAGNSNDQTFITLQVEQNLAYASFRTNGVDVSVSAGNISSNQWHHIAYTVNNGLLKLYVDGNLVAQTNFDSLYNFYESPVYRIGSVMYNGNYGPSTGLIDDIGIWNRALTTQEITNLYNACQLSVNTQPTNQTININTSAEFVVSSSDSSATYQWQTDFSVGFQNLISVGQYSGTTTDTLTVSNVTMSNNNQPFRCIISSGSCIDTSDVAVLTVNNNVGINEVSQSNLFSVYPNPAQHIINIKADAKLLGSVYSIYDNTGKILLTGKINSTNTIIELDNLSGGIYLFSVGENMKQTFKVIKE